MLQLYSVKMIHHPSNQPNDYPGILYVFWVHTCEDKKLNLCWVRMNRKGRIFPAFICFKTGTAPFLSNCPEAARQAIFIPGL